MPVKLMPLLPGRKTPMKDSYEQITDDPKTHLEWIRRGFNVAFMLVENGCVAADFDVKRYAREFYSKHKGIFNCIAETRKGAHFIWRGEARTRKMYDGDIEIGDLKGNGYIVAPPSIVNGWEYRFVDGYPFRSLEELMPFPSELFPEVQQTRRITREKVRKIDEYLSRIESFQGRHGSHGLVRAAAVCRDADLTESEATIRLLEWNRLPVVSPPWKPEEIARAITRVYMKGKNHA